MEIDLIFKVAAVGIIVAVLNVILKSSGRDDQALMITLAGIVVVIVMLVQQIGTLFSTLKSVFGL
ncbi:MAG: stage III sporulation protein AC [Clostridiales bacterium 43-6]|nr:MAG: stage III sporulation protein AC [Clostridiales bacterium 43-6]